jgi:hypothetical protein
MQFRPLFALLVLLSSVLRAESYVQFEFRVPSGAGNPFSRELSMDVTWPDGQTRRVPAFYVADDRYAVRVARSRAGEYIAGKITQAHGGSVAEVAAEMVGPQKVSVDAPVDLPLVLLHPQDRSRFVDSMGRTYFPIGMNVAWPDRGERMDYYAEVFPAMARHGLNWSRVWMSHWGRLNLDWLDATEGTSPAPGTLDTSIAENWDRVLALAERNGIYLQVVLQHHGQWSTRVNANWEINPWNSNNPGGFLARPEEFFTSPRAKELTRLKYRYVVARWGHSPAILAWELFNEVHFTDAMATPAGERAVADWHAEMAAYIRSIDVHGHLVTTSAHSLHSPIFAAMDYKQPHLYAPNMLAAVRLLDDPAEAKKGAVFYGEVGDEQMTLTADQTNAGVAMIPPIWASLAGASTHAAQIWYGNRMMNTDRLAELGSVAGFVRHTRYAEHRPWQPCEVPVDSNDTVPLEISGGHWWAKAPDAEIEVPADGREPAMYALVPRVLVGRIESKQEGYPSKVTFRVNYPEKRLLRLFFGDAGSKGARVDVWVNQRFTAHHVWSPRAGAGQTGSAGAPLPKPAELGIEMAKGTHEIVIENTGGEDIVLFDRIKFGLSVPRLAAAGKRSDTFIYVWVWNRTNVFAVSDAAPSEATLHIDEVPAGRWKLIWWDSMRGAVLSETVREHIGGRFSVKTPPVSRHAALAIEKL